MLVQAVRFSFTKNLGNFQSARAEVEVEREHKDETPQQLFNVARALVWQELGMDLDDFETAALVSFQERSAR